MRTKIFQLLTCLFALVFCNQSVQAQFARFVESGVIEFEKRVNMYAKIEDRVGENSFMEQAFRSEEHTSELQSLMRISYAVLCLKKKKETKHNMQPNTIKIDDPQTPQH